MFVLAKTVISLYSFDESSSAPVVTSVKAICQARFGSIRVMTKICPSCSSHPSIENFIKSIQMTCNLDLMNIYSHIRNLNSHEDQKKISSCLVALLDFLKCLNYGHVIYAQKTCFFFCENSFIAS